MSSQGWFVFRFDWLYKKTAFSDEAVRRQVLATINEIAGVHFDDDVLTKRARIPFNKLTTADALKKIKAAVASLIAQVKTESARDGEV